MFPSDPSRFASFTLRADYSTAPGGRPDVRRKPYQVVVSVLGAQHGGHLLQVGAVALLVHAAGEGDGDDPLCDVEQVQLVALLQGLQQTGAPVGDTEKRFPFKTHALGSSLHISGPAVQKQNNCWTARDRRIEY